MTQNVFKQLLDESLKPLQLGLNEVKQDLKEVKETQKEFTKKLEGFRGDLDEVKDTLETRVLPPLVYIEATVKSYADRYVTNQDHIGRLDKRLKKVEKKLDVYPPEELSIPSFE